MNTALIAMALSASLNVTLAENTNNQPALESNLMSKTDVLQILTEQQKTNTMLDGLNITLPGLFSSEELSLAVMNASDITANDKMPKREVSSSSNSEE